MRAVTLEDMNTWSLVLVPVVLLAGLLIGARYLSELYYREPPCTYGTCPLELSGGDSGKTFTYSVTTRFSIYLDASLDPPERLRCEPEGIVGSISDVPAVDPPLYAARFEAVAPGACALKDTNFSATIVVR